MEKRLFIALFTIFATAMLLVVLLLYPHLLDTRRQAASAQLRDVSAVLITMRGVYRERLQRSGLTVRAPELCPGAVVTQMSTQIRELDGVEVSFANLSDRPRNPANLADPDAMEAILHFRENPKSANHRLERRFGNGSGFIQYAVPLWTEEGCLTCHGAREDAPEAVREHYESGYGFELGDLHGVLTARLPLRGVDRAVVDETRHIAATIAGLFLAVIAAISLLLRPSLRGLESLRRESRRLADGEYWCELTEIGAKEVRHLIGSFNRMGEAITHRERELEERDRELIEAQRVGRVGSWRYEPRRDRVECSEECRRILSLPEGPMTLERFRGNLAEKWRERLDREWRKTTPERPNYEFYYLLDTVAGEHYLHERGEVRFARDGSIERVHGIVSDVTESYQSQKGARLAATVFTNAGEAIVITDAFARVVDVNPAFSAMTGYSREEVLGKPPPLTRADQKEEALFEKMLAGLLENGDWHGEVWARRKDDSLYPQLLHIRTVTDEQGGISHLVGTFSDITELKRSAEQLEQLAYFDPLTKLPNRALYKLRLERDLRLARRHATPLALLMIDLDHFKQINDSMGHEVGDLLLTEIAGRFLHAVRDIDTVVRLGGDEFAAILPDMENGNAAARVAGRMIEEAGRAVKVDGHQLFVGASIGIAMFPDDGTTPDELTRNADTAMYRAKNEGRMRFRLFEEAMNADAVRRMELTEALHLALDRDQFVLYYQPKYAPHDHRAVGVEALIRWHHPSLGLVPPSEFISVAEETGLIIPIGEWVLESACRQAYRWLDEGVEFGRMAVNLSPIQFQQPELARQVAETLERTGLPAERLELEITEGVILHDIELSLGHLRDLKAMGVRIAMDDFGTGYSSLGYLTRLPVDTLKIDRALIQEISHGTKGKNIVATILAMAENLGLEVVAEGVETADQEAFVKEKGCRQIQGFFYSHPLPPEEIEPKLPREARR